MCLHLREYVQRVRDCCDTYCVILILDEVMCGIGYEDSLFAREAKKIVPDIVCIAKCLSAAYHALGAMVCSEPTYDTIKTGSGMFQYGHNYVGHPVAKPAGYVSVKKIKSAQMVDRSGKLGEILAEAL